MSLLAELLGSLMLHIAEARRSGRRWVAAVLVIAAVLAALWVLTRPAVT